MKIFHLWKRPSQPEICNSKILLGFVCHGGVGDMLIASLYIQELGKIINYPTQIDVYGYTNKTINTAIFSDNTYIDRLFLRNDSEKSKAYYDVFCQINRFPHLDYVNEEKIKQLRHFLSGSPSCVLFGPTSPNVFGYSENINLKSNYCKFWCEWLSPNWQNECFAGFKNPLCMNGLNPEFVFNSIVPYLNYIKVK